MAAAFIQNRSAWERVAIAAVVMAPTFYALWAKRVDVPRGREALEEARRLSKELAEYGAVVIPPHGLATDPDQMELARTKVRMNTRLHWSELRLALQRFWRAAADETIDIDDPTTWPDPDKLDADWEARHSYTLRAPVAPLGIRSRISAAKWTRGDGAPQLVLAAFLDPSMSRVHFGDDTHRYLRLAVSERWYWLPWLGPPEGAVGIRAQQQGWRTPAFPIKGQGATATAESGGGGGGGGRAAKAAAATAIVTEADAAPALAAGCRSRAAHVSTGRPGAFAAVGALAQGAAGAGTKAGLEARRAVPAPLRSTEHQGSAGAAPGDAVDGEATPPWRRVAWFGLTGLASLVACEAPQDVTGSSGAPVVHPFSHRVLLRALRRAAEEGLLVPPGALEVAVRRWAASRSPAPGAKQGNPASSHGVQVDLPAGSQLLLLGSTARSVVWPAEPLPPPHSRTPLPRAATPLVWHEAQAWFPYRPASLPQDEPSAAELQAMLEALPADSPARALFEGAPPARSTKDAAMEDADVEAMLAELRAAASDSRA
ncbi:hypothetical protein FNF27_06862 [Cafeteria roenbergensis]|uniref:Uncharacterized protein n=2 Tax=Cafeteria roenbergensis TaxID=33653 RepID=A0A5A8DX71_CAFRO|nr:hypothetical protein FNF27_06862 [Cafeteria roenbergensis]